MGVCGLELPCRGSCFSSLGDLDQGPEKDVPAGGSPSSRESGAWGVEGPEGEGGAGGSVEVWWV